MKKILVIVFLLNLTAPLFPAVFNPFLNQIRDMYEGKTPYTFEQKNSLLKAYAFGTALPSEILVLGKGDSSSLLKYGGRIETRTGRYFTAFVPVSALGSIQGESSIEFLNYELPAQKYLDNAYPYVSANQTAAAGYRGDDVIIGVVDTGIDVNSLDFKTDNGLTRIISLWDQNVSGSHPYGFDYGAEYLKYDIDAGNCPEYDEQFHGTHVTGIAAGNGKRSSGLYTGISPRANIVFVKYNFNSMGYLLDAVSYIFNKAKSLNKPCVINLSLGNQAGSHTQNDDFNQAMDEVVNYYGQNAHIIVWAAGNDGSNPVHNTPTTVSTTVPVNVLITYSVSPMYAAFWYNASFLSGYAIDPTSAKHYFTNNSGVTANFNDADVNIQCGMNGMYEKYVNLTIHSSKTGGSGWKVVFDPNASSFPVDGYVMNYNSQNFNYNYFTATQVTGSLSGQASEKLAISVGAMVTKTNYTDVTGFTYYNLNIITNGNIAWFSSRGPTRDGQNKPDISAPGSYVVSVYANTPGFSLLSSEQNYQFIPYYAVMQGTSMAAPMVTGIIAQMLEKETNLTVNDIQQKFMSYAKINSYKTNRTWDSDFGYGIADLSFLTTVNAALARLDVSFKNNVLNVSQDKDNQLYILFRSNSTQVGKTVRAAVYDKNGGLIRDFGSVRVNQIEVKEYVWNGKDQFTRTVQPGLYFVQISLDNDTSRYPVLVVR